MKKIFLLLLAGSTFFVSCKQKIGYINSNEVLKEDLKKADTSLQGFGKELQTTFNSGKTNYDAKVKKLADSARMSTADKDALKKEINDLATKLNTFANEAGQQIQAKKSELLNPLYKKLDEAIKEVAKDDGYDFVIDVAVTPFAFAGEKHNINDEIKKKIK